ncbi:MAG TPA: glycosyltransferase family 87 protein [Xanthobacteraceae bacterium]|jgi:hypothetical protein|nr:glycosyltransferase family 87 protein [Xanthobacteraceae bacterium]
MPDACSHDPAADSRSLLQAFALLSAAFVVMAAVRYLSTISWVDHFPRDATTLVVGRDFLNFWMYGLAAATPDPGRWYDPAIYNGELAALLGPDYPGQNWSYPPSIMLVAAPFAALSYLQALACWTAASVLLFVLVARAHLNDRRALLAVLLSPAAVFCLMSGQSSFVTAAMLITIFAWLGRMPIGAGVLIGLLTLKPQLGLFIPVMLIASGRWRVMATATVTAMAIVGVTTAAFGPQAWIDFVVKGIPVQNVVLADPELIGTPFRPTIFATMRLVGATYPVAMAVQMCFSALAVAAVLWAFRFRRRADPRWLAALFFACSIFGSPYLQSYDLLPMTFAIVALLATGRLDVSGRVLARLVFWLPLIQAGLGSLHVPGTALIPLAFALYALRRLADRSDWGRSEPSALTDTAPAPLANIGPPRPAGAVPSMVTAS